MFSETESDCWLITRLWNLEWGALVSYRLEAFNDPPTQCIMYLSFPARYIVIQDASFSIYFDNAASDCSRCSIPTVDSSSFISSRLRDSIPSSVSLLSSCCGCLQRPDSISLLGRDWDLSFVRVLEGLSRRGIVEPELRRLSGRRLKL